MKCLFLVAVFLAIFISWSSISNGGVRGALIELSGPQCGSFNCKTDEYCNQFNHGCEPCQNICDPSNHNLDTEKCKQQCQVYIYDQRYFRKTSSGADDDNLRVAVQDLKLKYAIAISLIVIVIIILIIVLAIFVWRWKTNNNVTWACFHKAISGKKSDNNTNGVSGNKVSNDQVGRKPDLRLEITTNSVQSEPTPVTVTTGITTRIPAEDSIDYAYDNPAMSNSPKKSGSTTS